MRPWILRTWTLWGRDPAENSGPLGNCRSMRTLSNEKIQRKKSLHIHVFICIYIYISVVIHVHVCMPQSSYRICVYADLICIPHMRLVHLQRIQKQCLACLFSLLQGNSETCRPRQKGYSLSAERGPIDDSSEGCETATFMTFQGSTTSILTHSTGKPKRSNGHCDGRTMQ